MAALAAYPARAQPRTKNRAQRREDGGGPPCPCIEHRDVKRGQYLPVLVPRVPPGGGSRPRCGSTGVFTWGHSGGLDRLGWPSLHVPRLGARHPFAGGTLASRFLSCGRWGVASCCPGDPLPLLVLLFLLSWSLSSVERGWDIALLLSPSVLLRHIVGSSGARVLLIWFRRVRRVLVSRGCQRHGLAHRYQWDMMAPCWGHAPAAVCVAFWRVLR